MKIAEQRFFACPMNHTVFFVFYALTTHALGRLKSLNGSIERRQDDRPDKFLWLVLVYQTTEAFSRIFGRLCNSERICF